MRGERKNLRYWAEGTTPGTPEARRRRRHRRRPSKHRSRSRCTGHTACTRYKANRRHSWGRPPAPRSMPCTVRKQHMRPYQGDRHHTRSRLKCRCCCKSARGKEGETTRQPPRGARGIRAACGRVRGQGTYQGVVSRTSGQHPIVIALIAVAGLCGHPHAHTERRISSVCRGACEGGLLIALEGSLGAGTHAGRALGADALLRRGQHAVAGAVRRRVHDNLRDVADASKRIGKSVAGCLLFRCTRPTACFQGEATGRHVERPQGCCAGAPGVGAGVQLHHNCTIFAGVLVVRLTCSASPPNQTCLPSKAVESD